MIDAAVRLVAAALRDPVTGIAVQLPRVPGVPEGVRLPPVRVVDEASTAWLARGALPSQRELAEGPLVAVHGHVEVSPDGDADAGRPWVTCPVTISYVARDVDAHQLLASARHTQRAVVRAVLLAWSAPLLTAGEVSVQRPEAGDVVRAKAFEPWGDAVAVLDTVVTLRALDPWTFALV